MMLTDVLPQSTAFQMSNNAAQAQEKTELAESLATTAEPATVSEQPPPVSTIKFSLVSSQPILATSPEFILVNEHTKRRNLLVLFDANLERSGMYSSIRQPLLDGLWYEKGRLFLLLTKSNVYAFDPHTWHLEVIQSIAPTQNTDFKCFTLLNQSTLLIAYNQWAVEYVDKWQQDANTGSWNLTGKFPLPLTYNELIGNMILVTDDSHSYLAITLYNDLTEEWRLEVRDTETGLSHQTILLPACNITHDYRVVSVKNTESDVKFLAFCSTNSNIIAIDSHGKKTILNYKNPVQRMALFNENQLIVRTTERVDVHLFL